MRRGHFLLALFVPCVAPTSQEEVIKPKNIDISLTAKWPSTPIAVEAAEYLASTGSPSAFWSFIEAFKSPAGASDRAQLTAVNEAAAALLSPLGLKVLNVFLAAHVFSPMAELWRQDTLAQEAKHNLSNAAAWAQACGTVKMLSENIREVLVSLLDGCDWSTPEEVLPVDHVLGSSSTGVPTVILTAPMGSPALSDAHAVLKEMASAGRILYVYRPLVKPKESTGLQSLQGYGVQLAIKNMEYKAMDDKSVADLGGIEESAAATGDGDDADEADEQGFLFKTISTRRPELVEQLNNFREVLAASEAKGSEQLKVWALQDLGVQASARVLASKDPLRTLRDICQNFPFLARSISKAKVDPALEDEINHLQSSSWGPGYSGAFLNGRPLPVDSNDLFSLLQTMQRELQTVDALARLQLDASAIRSLISLPAPTASIRVDMAHTAVLMLNDVAKDRRYQQWPDSVRDLLRPNMFGQLPFCRKNVYTLVFVLDPGTELGLAVLGYMIGILQQGAPIRFGIVLTPGSTRKSFATRRSSAYVSGSGRSRLVPLASVYNDPAWSDPSVKKLEARAKELFDVHASSSDISFRGTKLTTEETEAERLGLLLSKLFIFCKKKAGTSAALNFLALQQEVREVGGFFGSSLEQLQEQHLQQAFEQALARSRKSIDARPIFEGFKTGALTDFDAEVQAGLDFLADKGLSEPPLLLANGMLSRLSHNFEQEVMSALGAESQHLISLVRRGKLTDAAEDVPAAISAASAQFPRFNKELLVTADKIQVATLRPASFLKAKLSWITNSDGRTSNAAGAQDMSGKLYSVSHVLAVDLCDIEHVELAAQALHALEQSKDGRARLALLHNPANTRDECSRTAVAAWSVTAAADAPLEAVRRLLALQFVALRALLTSGAPLSSPLLSPYVQKAETLLSDGTADSLLFDHRSLADELSIAAGAAAVITNGRVIEVSPGSPIDSVDFGLLEEFEYRQRAEGAARLISKLDPSLGAGTMAWRSNVLMFAISELSKMAQATQEASSGRQIQLQPGDIPCGKACVQLPGEGPGAAMELTAILNPLSKEAQRFAPVMMELQQALGLTISLHLNPDLKISEFPLENFYRYVVDLAPHFDDAGSSIAYQTDHAIFSSLRTPQVLTLHLDAPEPWLVQVTEAVYDMDNLKLAELGSRSTVIARYELSSLLITGSCEDVSSRDPPNGLQLLLGTSAAPHVTDTLVMSNLGYFQLKAAPGAWALQLAPGPSSEVYEIQADPALLSSGHSLRRAQRQRIHVDSLVVMPMLQIVVSSFSGAHTLLLVRKKQGMERASILDGDTKQVSGAASDDGYLSSLSGGISSWLGGSKTAAAADDTVHIFSLASGHLYERFLLIMIQSVIEKTTRRVKFWLLKNFLSPNLIGFLPTMAKKVGFDYELVQYQWPTWLHKQTNKQRIIWGYKILFLDVMFPLNVRKIIYIDADQVVNADVGELWDLKMSRNAAVAMTPFCQKDENKQTTGFRFFAQGYWRDHLRGRPYHISALFVIDLYKFRRRGYGDQYRVLYDNLSKDPNSLANLDQDLPNYAQHMVPIHSLPEEWLWCETWCGNSSKPTAKTIDLCNNPLTKEPKLSQATRVIGERWTALDHRRASIAEEESFAADSEKPAIPHDEL